MIDKLKFLLPGLAIFLVISMPVCWAQENHDAWKLERFSKDTAGLLKAAAELKPPAGADVVVLDDEEDCRFEADGRATCSWYLVYKILTQNGVQGWDDVSVSWEPWHDERPTVRARVITPEMAIHILDPKTITDSPAQDDANNIYSDRRVVRAPFPAIAVGSIVEEEETVKENAPLFSAGMVRRQPVGRFVPVQHSRLVLDAPSSLAIRYNLQLLPDLKPQRSEQNGRVRLVFESGPMEALTPIDRYLPSNVTAIPSVTFSTGTSWQQVAVDYGKIVDSNVAASDVKPLVGKLVAGKLSREEKAAAILQYLDREIRYTGVEFGEASITPHAPAETLSHKYGDCKDKAVLLVAMLRAADIPAYVALLNAGHREDVPPDLPGMGIFDHAIVYAPGTPDYWIDATDDYSRLGQLPSVDQGRSALLTREGTQALVLIPESPSQDNRLLEKREFYLAENGPARVVEISEPHGSMESDYRSIYADKENKDRTDGLKEYVRTQYLSDKLSRMDRSDPADLSKQFQLVLEAGSAKRGFTDLDSAVVAIRFDTLFSRLPDELTQRETTKEKDKDKDAANEKPKKIRTADYQLPEAFVTEWQYKIVSPAGFQPKPLPANTKIQLGPALLTEEFSAENTGIVRVDIRFDTVKRRMSPTEASEMRNKIAEVREGQPVLIYFEPAANALFNAGKMREGLQSYRDLIAAHPDQAVYHLRMAKALLLAGMGGAARDEARLAVKLEPKSALAEKTLAGVLEYDLVGREFRRGSDYAGAEAAYRAAQKLDPDDKEITGALAVLLEYDNEGERYGPSSKLKEAAAVYRTLDAEQLAEGGLKNNLAYTLIYAGQFAEARKYAESLNPQMNAVIVAAEAALNGSQAGLAEARKRTNGENDLKEAARTAGQILMRARQYPPAADLLEASAAGENASNTVALASTLRKARPYTELTFKDDPAGLVMKSFLFMCEGKLTVDDISKFSSRNARLVLSKTDKDELDESVKSQNKLRTMLARGGFPADVMADIIMQIIEPSVEGNDATGYRVTVRIPGGKNLKFYVVKEEGKYKVLDSSEKPNSVGLEILDRLAAHDNAGARVLLDWVREDQHLEGGDDPLSGAAFPRFWTKGKEADPEQMKLAAAAILVQTKPTAQQGISLLEAALSSAPSDAVKLNISTALLAGYANLEDYGKLFAVASELAKQFPESKRVFMDEILALCGLGRFEDADKLAQDRLARMPDDIDAMRGLIKSAAMRGDYARARDLGGKIELAGKAEGSDLNQTAWYTLFTPAVGKDDIETALKAARMSQNNPAELHTLGCVYAEVGKTKEAREVLIQAMDLLSLDEPQSEYWYAFGRIAEQYGLREVALSYYARVTQPKSKIELPGSSYQLAQNRLKVMGSAPDQKSPTNK